MNLAGIEEVVADKGYHSGAALVAMKEAAVRTYIPEKKQAGKRHWIGKKDEQQAVYANRERVSGNYGKSLLRKRGELIERSFAHCYDTGAMRRTHLRGHDNILKRQLIHVGAFNLSLIFRSLIGAGTPRELRNRLTVLVFVLERLIYSLRDANGDPKALTLPCRVSKSPHTHRGCLDVVSQKDGVSPRAARVPEVSSPAAGGGRNGCRHLSGTNALRPDCSQRLSFHVRCILAGISQTRSARSAW